MNTRWLRAAACMTATGLLAAAAVGCERPVDIGSAGGQVGTTQTTSADLSTGSGDSAQATNGGDNGTINNVHGGQNDVQLQPSQPSAPQQQDQPPSQSPQQGQPSSTAPAAPPVAGYGTLPMPNAETSVGSYDQNTAISGGGGSGVDVSGTPAQVPGGSNVSSANAPLQYSSSASNAINNSGPAPATVVVAAGPAPNDVAAANRASSQSVYNSGANQSALGIQQTRGQSNSTIQPQNPNAAPGANTVNSPNVNGNARPVR